MTKWALLVTICVITEIVPTKSFHFQSNTMSIRPNWMPRCCPLHRLRPIHSSLAPDEAATGQGQDKKEEEHSPPAKHIVHAQVVEAVPKNLSSAISFFLYDSSNPAPLIVLATIASLITYYVKFLPHLSPLSTMVAFLSVGGFWIVQEYILHRWVLHSFEWAGKEIHQGHHNKPYYHNSIDPPLMIITWMSTAGVLLKLLLPQDPSLWVVSLVSYSAFGLWYEFLHFLSHTRVPFTPGSGVGGYFHRVKANHMRHHRVDSQRWFTFTAPGSVDEWWGTGGGVRDRRRN